MKSRFQALFLTAALALAASTLNAAAGLAAAPPANPSATKMLAGGDAAPNLPALQSVAKGGVVQPFNINAASKGTRLVLYFFPAAFTSGCTVETKAFEYKLADFSKAGATVVGISYDPIDKLKQFQAADGPSLRMVSDLNGEAAHAYGVSMTEDNQTIAKRVTFIIRDGKIEHSIFNWSGLANVNQTLAWLTAHP
jgi:thioredoxin-dependent peroxiredoxin